MEIYEIVTGVLMLIAFAVFAFYAVLAVRHAARFRYLSTRTIYLTLSFVALSACILVACLIVYSTVLFN